jgi:hypothetical protein
MQPDDNEQAAGVRLGVGLAVHRSTMQMTVAPGARGDGFERAQGRRARAA